MQKDIKSLFLYFGDHWFHRRLAEELRAIPRSAILTSKSPNILLKPLVLAYWSANLPEGYEVYLCEDTYMFPALRKMFFGLKNTVIINITAGSLMYYLVTGKINFAIKPIYVHLMRYVDLFVCVSELEQDLVRQLFPKARTVVVNPYIRQGIRKRLLSENLPSLNNHNIIIIAYGHSVYYKGLDIAVDVFKKVRQQWADATLTIVGKWDKDTVSKYSAMDDNIRFTGYINDILQEIRKASLSIHLARGEGFGINIIETMLAGVPTIVSDSTGAKEAVAQLDQRFIVPLNVDLASAVINSYFSMDLAQKRAISKKARRIASIYTERRSINSFNRSIHNALNNR